MLVVSWLCFFTLFPFLLFSHLTSSCTHHSFSAALTEICTGCTARAAVRDGVPVPEGGGRTHLCVWGCYNGRRCSQDCPAYHQTGGQHEPRGCWLFHQQAPGKSEGNSAVHCTALSSWCSPLNNTETLGVVVVWSALHRCRGAIEQCNHPPVKQARFWSCWKIDVSRYLLKK